MWVFSLFPDKISDVQVVKKVPSIFLIKVVLFFIVLILAMMSSLCAAFTLF